MVPENRNLKIVDNRRQPHAAMSPLSPDACRNTAITDGGQRLAASR